MNFNKNCIMKNSQRPNEKKKKKKILLHPASWISILLFAGFLPPIAGQTTPVCFWTTFFIAVGNILDAAGITIPEMTPIPTDPEFWYNIIKGIEDFYFPPATQNELWTEELTEFIEEKITKDPNFIKKFPVFFDAIYSTKSFQVFLDTYFAGTESVDSATFNMSTHVYFEEYWASIDTQIPYEDYWNDFEKHLPGRNV